METMEIIDKCFDEMADIPNEHLNHDEIGKKKKLSKRGIANA